ncbi:MAG: hypothetical protein RML46_00715 [Anaerolineae bacterium]|nr:hypothetical protein [Anaerolineae bacterium]MDW8067416.1 hypothetical protein [Anaerolineae bacterium]
MLVGPVRSPDLTLEGDRVPMELLQRATVAQRFRLTRSLSQMAIALTLQPSGAHRWRANKTEVHLTFGALWSRKDPAEELRR